MIKKVFAFMVIVAMLVACIPVPALALAKDYKNYDPQKYYLVLDLGQQYITVLAKDKNGEYTKVVRRILVSTGKVGSGAVDPATGEKDEGTPTPVGVWKIGGHERFGKFVSFSSWARYWTQLVDSNLMHSTMFSRRSVNSMQAGAYGGLGGKASHGCVRMYIEDAKWVYYNCPPGTTCEVVNKSTLWGSRKIKLALKSKSSFATYNKFQKKIFDEPELPNTIAYVTKEGTRLMSTTKMGSSYGALKVGATLEVLMDSDPWCKVKYGNRMGYIRRGYITFNQDKTPDTEQNVTIIKSNQAAKVYLEPTGRSKQVFKIPNYSTVKIVEPDVKGWTKVRYWYTEGYVQTKLIKKDWALTYDWSK